MERRLSSEGKTAPEILYRSGANNSSDMLRKVDGPLTRDPGLIMKPPGLASGCRSNE